MNDSDQGKVNVICLKWGTAYPPFYVNRLYAGVRRHMKRPFRFICFTNEPDGLDAGIDEDEYGLRRDAIMKAR